MLTTFLLWTYVVFCANCVSDAGIAPPDADSLLRIFYNATHGQSWQAKCSTDWCNSSVSVCDWNGVTCNDQRTVVTALSLSDCGLSGTLPLWLLETSPASTSEVISVKLTRLDLSHNKIGGTLPRTYGVRTQSFVAMLLYALQQCTDGNAATRDQ
jgi:hypothetical protein